MFAEQVLNYLRDPLGYEPPHAPGQRQELLKEAQYYQVGGLVDALCYDTVECELTGLGAEPEPAGSVDPPITVLLRAILVYTLCLSLCLSAGTQGVTVVESKRELYLCSHVSIFALETHIISLYCSNVARSRQG